VRRNRIAATGGDLPVIRRSGRKWHHQCAHSRRMLRALFGLVRSRRQIEQVPTLMQVRAIAHFNGREPSSYLLDRA
jgi:hypothetical protein